MWSGIKRASGCDRDERTDKKKEGKKNRAREREREKREKEKDRKIGREKKRANAGDTRAGRGKGSSWNLHITTASVPRARIKKYGRARFFFFCILSLPALLERRTFCDRYYFQSLRLSRARLYTTTHPLSRRTKGVACSSVARADERRTEAPEYRGPRRYTLAVDILSLFWPTSSPRTVSPASSSRGEGCR